ncbi:MAG: hypothetical protein K8R85_11985 [Bacteroidetes bacterium]|nr:hypothetical protein [Bacteroidota bacterium]
MGLKYYLFCSLLFCIVFLKAQEYNGGSQAVISIIGDDPIQTNNTHDFINTNPYHQTDVPPDHSQKVQKNQNIEPTLENGFHMRFEVSSSQPIAQMGTSSFSTTGEDDEKKVKRRGKKLNERSLNIKKRIKRALPTRKKKYHPTNCGRF